MSIHTDELRTRPLESLITPSELAHAFPINDRIAQNLLDARRDVEAILAGEDQRLLVIVGPCSIHDPAAAHEYALRLNALREQYKGSLCIVMRTYFEKPRTIVGWKGHINETGMPTATEFLDMVTGQYISDLITWGAIGARTTESQVHREMASALSCPVGFKNGTDGNTRIAIDAVRAARHSHIFYSPDKDGKMTIYRTAGNPYGHVILRGGHRPNYDTASVDEACEALGDVGLPQRLVVDFSHGNSMKDHRRQLLVAQDICDQLRRGRTGIAGIMAESFLVEGRQDVENGCAATFGQSITDACLSWADTETLLAMLAEAAQVRLDKHKA